MAFYAGSFLVARPVLEDPPFRRAVVLLLQHDDDGAFGLVVNRKAAVKGLPFPVYVGGPCKSEGLFMLHGQEDWVDSSEPVAPGIFLGDNESAERVGDTEPGQDARFRMFHGYAGWGPKQLENELAAGAWAVVAANGDLLFDTPLDDLWATLLPTALPDFSAN